MFWPPPWPILIVQRTAAAMNMMTIMTHNWKNKWDWETGTKCHIYIENDKPLAPMEQWTVRLQNQFIIIIY